METPKSSSIRNLIGRIALLSAVASSNTACNHQDCDQAEAQSWAESPLNIWHTNPEAIKKCSAETTEKTHSYDQIITRAIGPSDGLTQDEEITAQVGAISNLSRLAMQNCLVRELNLKNSWSASCELKTFQPSNLSTWECANLDAGLAL